MSDFYGYLSQVYSQHVAHSAAFVGTLSCCWVTWLQPRLEQKEPVESRPMPSGSHWLLGHHFGSSERALRKSREPL